MVIWLVNWSVNGQLVLREEGVVEALGIAAVIDCNVFINRESGTLVDYL